jgi:hypothetical protein
MILYFPVQFGAGYLSFCAKLKKMNTAIIIFVTAFVLIVIVPATIIRIDIKKKMKKKEKQFMQSLSRLAEENNCKISDYQMWHNTMIAADRETRRMFFLRKTAESEVIRQINLEEIERCRVAPTCRSVSRNDRTYIVTDRIELAFTPRTANNPETFLEFYNSKQDSPTLHGELQNAEMWATYANSMINGCRNN